MSFKPTHRLTIDVQKTPEDDWRFQYIGKSNQYKGVLFSGCISGSVLNASVEELPRNIEVGDTITYHVHAARANPPQYVVKAVEDGHAWVHQKGTGMHYVSPLMQLKILDV